MPQTTGEAAPRPGISTFQRTLRSRSIRAAAWRAVPNRWRRARATAPSSVQRPPERPAACCQHQPPRPRSGHASQSVGSTSTHLEAPHSRETRQAASRSPTDKTPFSPIVRSTPSDGPILRRNPAKTAAFVTPGASAALSRHVLVSASRSVPRDSRRRLDQSAAARPDRLPPKRRIASSGSNLVLAGSGRGLLIRGVNAAIVSLDTAGTRAARSSNDPASSVQGSCGRRPVDWLDSRQYWSNHPG